MRESEREREREGQKKREGEKGVENERKYTPVQIAVDMTQSNI